MKTTSNKIFMASCVLIVKGYILMSGPGTEQSFNPDIFSAQRIVIAPMLCLAGYLLIIVGILRRR
jgi:hypothetical protein